MELGLGGGICQLSSTIYAAALKAGIERHTRAAHMYTVTYIDLGLDATVAYPYTDYVFRNNTGYPVRIDVTFNGSKVTVKIMGTKTSNTTIEFIMDFTETLLPEFSYVVDESMAPGDPEKRDTYSFGYIVDTYKVTYIDGVFVNSYRITTSKYLPYPQKINVYLSPEDYAAKMAELDTGD